MSTLEVNSLIHLDASSNNLDLDSSGNVTVLNGKLGIGTTSPYGALDVQSSTRSQIVSTIADDAALWCSNNSAATGSGGALQVYSNSSHTGTRNVMKITNDHSSAVGAVALYVQQDSTKPAIVTNGGGITFNGDTSANNALDDYEEGTWTPVWSGANSSAATYTKIGRVVYASGQFTATGSGTSGNMEGLPYSSALDGSDGGGSGYHGQDSLTWSILKTLGATFRFYTGGTQKQLTGSQNIRFFLTYMTA